VKSAAAWSLLAVAVCCVYGPGEIAFVGDNRGQFFIAERVASGVPPHISSISGKSSLSFLISGAGIFVGRVAGLPDYWSVRLVSILVLAGSVGLCWVVTYRLLREESRQERADCRTAAHLAALAMMSFHGYFYQGVMGARPKIFLVLFVFLTLLAVVAKRPFWTGVAGALAFLCWQPALIVLAASIVPLALSRRRVRSAQLWSVGIALTLLLYEAYFVYHGAWREQLFQTFVFAGKYMRPEHTSVIVNPALLLRTWGEGFSPINPAAVFLVLSMVVFWYGVLANPRSARSFCQRRPSWSYLQICAVGAVGFTLYDHQGYPDLFFLIPYMAIATGAMVLWIEVRTEKIWLRVRGRPDPPTDDQRPPPHTPRWKRPLRWAAAVALVLIAITGERSLDRRVRLEDQLALAGEVGDLSPELSGIYAVNCTHLLALNRKSNWNEYGHFFRGVRALMLERTSGTDRPPWRDGRLPDLILISGRMPPEISAALQAEYVRVKKRHKGRQRVTVWRRNESRAATSR
jgi:hypothetical protein